MNCHFTIIPFITGRGSLFLENLDFGLAYATTWVGRFSCWLFLLEVSFGLSILQKPDDWQWHRDHDVFWMRTANEDKMTTYEMGSSSFSRGRNHIHHTNLMWGMFEQYSNVLRWRVQFPTLFNRCEFRKECNNHNPV